MSDTTTSAVTAPQDIGDRSFFERYHVFQVVVAAIIIAGHFPLLEHHFQRLWTSNHYRYFPIVLVAVGYLLWTRWMMTDARRSTLNGHVFCWLGAGLLLLVLSILYWWSWSAMVALICTCRAMQLSFEDKSRNRYADSFSIWLLLWLLLSIPLTWDVELVYQLQDYSSLAASFVLDFLGINHLLHGHVVNAAEQRFFVDEACSGVRSLFAILACTALFVVFTRRSWLHTILLLVAAAVWTLLVNVMRITIVVVAGTNLGVNISTGWQHELLGLVLFGFALLMLFSTDRLLLFLLSPVPRPGRNPYINPYYNSPYTNNPYLRDAHLNNPYLASRDSTTAAGAVSREADNRKDGDASSRQDSSATAFLPVATWCVVAVTFGAIGIAQFILASKKQDEFDNVTFASELLPREHSVFTFEKFKPVERPDNSYYGKYSDTWMYRSPGSAASISCDYPFFDWHSLTKCYRGSGWRQVRPPAESGLNEQYEVLNLDQSESAAGIPETRAVYLRSPDGELAYLLFSVYRSDGKPIRPPGREGKSLSWLWTEIRRNVVEHFAVRFGSDRLAYQFQILVVGEQCRSLEHRRQIDQFYHDSRQRLLQRLVGETMAVESIQIDPS